MQTSFTQVLQLYAPLVGLVGVAFWMGVLSARIRQLEKDSKPATLVELNVRMAAVEKDVAGINHTLQGMNRQLANIAMGKMGHAVEIRPGEHL